MSGWKTGQAQIAALVERRHLEQVSGDAANGVYLLQQARQRLVGARAARSADHIGAFELAYDATRQALTALLAQQGLRPTTAGATSPSPTPQKHSSAHRFGRSTACAESVTSSNIRAAVLIWICLPQIPTMPSSTPSGSSTPRTSFSPNSGCGHDLDPAQLNVQSGFHCRQMLGQCTYGEQIQAADRHPRVGVSGR